MMCHLYSPLFRLVDLQLCLVIKIIYISVCLLHSGGTHYFHMHARMKQTLNGIQKKPTIADFN